MCAEEVDMMPDVGDWIREAWWKGIEAMFELTAGERILVSVAVVLAVAAIILLIRWVD